jgi:hypothetical protein
MSMSVNVSLSSTIVPVGGTVQISFESNTEDAPVVTISDGGAGRGSFDTAEITDHSGAFTYSTSSAGTVTFVVLSNNVDIKWLTSDTVTITSTTPPTLPNSRLSLGIGIGL